jgi:hypothetical protein
MLLVVGHVLAEVIVSELDFVHHRALADVAGDYRRASPKDAWRV